MDNRFAHNGAKKVLAIPEVWAAYKVYTSKLDYCQAYNMTLEDFENFFLDTSSGIECAGFAVSLDSITLEYALRNISVHYYPNHAVTDSFPDEKGRMVFFVIRRFVAP